MSLQVNNNWRKLLCISPNKYKASPLLVCSKLLQLTCPAGGKVGVDTPLDRAVGEWVGRRGWMLYIHSRVGACRGRNIWRVYA